MPNQTIDLWNGLEVWYDLDPRYYDDQRGVLADKSGHGRYADPTGGVTFGVEAPASFVAGDFNNGGDQRMDTGFNYDIQSPFTVATRFKLDDNNNQYHIAGTRGAKNEGWMLRFSTSANNYQFGVFDGTGSYLSAQLDRVETGWITIIGKFGGLDSSITLTSDQEQTDIEPAPSAVTTSSNNIGIGGAVTGAKPMDGKIAFTGLWNRELSSAEIEYLNNLTAPPRSL